MLEWLRKFPGFAFDDPAVEAEFQRDSATRVIGAHGVLWSIAAFVWGGSAFLDSTMAGSPANEHLMTVVRFAALPALVAAAAVALSPSLFARWRQAASAVGLLAVLGGQIGMTMLMPEPQRMSDVSIPTSVVVTLFALCVWCGVLGVHLYIPVTITLAQAFGYASQHDRFPGRQPTSLVIWYTLAMLLGWIVAAMLERSRRATYLALRSLDAERERSDQLLHNMLPQSIAARLKADPRRIADHFSAATVLFADIVGFTPLAVELPPDEMVAALDALFSRFDDLAKRHGLEKIKTIGDAYMVVGGVPLPRPDHAEAVARMALDMRELVARWAPLGGRQLQLRIGVHTGPVVAGVIGKAKFVYDLWGDAVNTASRMESQGIEGAIQVSETTRALLAGKFELRARGAVQIKGKGEMQTWFLDGALEPTR